MYVEDSTVNVVHSTSGPLNKQQSPHMEYMAGRQLILDSGESEVSDQPSDEVESWVVEVSSSEFRETSGISLAGTKRKQDQLSSDG